MAESEDNADQETLQERDVHQTLLPSLTLSVLGGASRTGSASSRPPPEELKKASEAVAPAEPNRTRGAKTGDLIGLRYLVEGQLGRGGMGRVMRVRHQALGKSFALKLIKAPIATDPAIREMFYREARLASALNHEHICSVVDFGEDPSFGLFMVMELLDGQTLHHKTRHGGALAAKAACDVMWQVCNAVRFMHTRSIIHGDLKSENVLLLRGTSQQRIVKLLDFGLARPDAKNSTGVFGTPEYLSPERIAGGPASKASDIYALGILFFEILTAKLPFVGSVEEIFQHHQHSAMPKAVDHGADSLDERADALIAKATAKDPAQRHSDVAGLMYELRTLMNMLGMETSRRRATSMSAGEGGTRERRDVDHRLKAEAELLANAPIPVASVDKAGRVRLGNAAFFDFIGAAGDAGGIHLDDTGLEEVCPTLFADLAKVVITGESIKRVIQLSEGGDRLVEAAIVMTPAPRSAEVTAGEIHLLFHPLRWVTDAE